MRKVRKICGLAVLTAVILCACGNADVDEMAEGVSTVPVSRSMERDAAQEASQASMQSSQPSVQSSQASSQVPVQESEEVQDRIQMEYENVKVGNIIRFGRYEQDADLDNGTESIEWIVMQKEEDKLLLLSRYALDFRRYDKPRDDVTVLWENCELREWLNTKFYDAAFDEKEQQRIVFLTNRNPDSYDFFNSQYMEERYHGLTSGGGTENGDETQDNVFLFSYEDALNRFASDDARKCAPTEYASAKGAREKDGACQWTLRSLGYDHSNLIGIDLFGKVGNLISVTSQEAVRPAIWISRKPQEVLEAEEPKPDWQMVEAEKRAQKEAEKIAGIGIGEIITFGHYEQDNDESDGMEPIEWIVLEKEADRMLVLSLYGLDYQQYHTDVDSYATWETCTVRSWLNDSFYNTAFNEDEKAKIIQVTNSDPGSIDYLDSDYALELYSINKHIEYGMGRKGGNDTDDYVFLLSYEEALKYFPSDEARKCTPTEYLAKIGYYSMYHSRIGWWLRSPGFDGINGEWNDIFLLSAMWVDSEGVLGAWLADDTQAVRPAMWISGDF